MGTSVHWRRRQGASQPGRPGRGCTTCKWQSRTAGWQAARGSARPWGLRPQVGKQKIIASKKARRVLGWQPRAGDEALLATARSLLDLGIADAGHGS
jgi:dihydroflavonol-4-reductase